MRIHVPISMCRYCQKRISKMRPPRTSTKMANATNVHLRANLAVACVNQEITVRDPHALHAWGNYYATIIHANEEGVTAESRGAWDKVIRYTVQYTPSLEKKE